MHEYMEQSKFTWTRGPYIVSYTLNFNYITDDRKRFTYTYTSLQFPRLPNIHLYIERTGSYGASRRFKTANPVHMAL